MKLSVVFVGEGKYVIEDTKYGWELCSVSYSAEALEKFEHWQLVDFMERMVDFIGGQLRDDC